MRIPHRKPLSTVTAQHFLTCCFSVESQCVCGVSLISRRRTTSTHNPHTYTRKQRHTTQVNESGTGASILDARPSCRVYNNLCSALGQHTSFGPHQVTPGMKIHTLCVNSSFSRGVLRESIVLHKK